MINSYTRVHSLYGSPVSHSLSPVIFNRTFEKLCLNRTYVPFEITKDKLEDAVEAARMVDDGTASALEAAARSWRNWIEHFIRARRQPQIVDVGRAST